MKHFIALILSMASVLVFLPAQAQVDGATPEQQAAAESLYREGMALYKAEKYEQACKYFEESLQQDDAITVQYYLAQCYKKQGRVASAWSSLMEVFTKSKKAGMDGRAELARKEADELQPRLPKLTIVVPPEVASLEGLQVTRNDTLVSNGQLGLAVPVDPGVQRIQVRAAGYKPWEGDGETSEGQATTIAVPMLEALPQAVEIGPVDSGMGASVGPMAEEEGNVLPVVGFVIAGVGLAAVGTGIALGIVAKGQNDDAECGPDGLVCTPEGVKQQEDSFALASIATGVTIGGAVLAAAGATIAVVSLVNNGDNADDEALAFGIGLNGVSLQGAW